MSYNSKYTGAEVEAALDSIEGKQDKLVSGTNIKTINGESILGSGDITIESGSSAYPIVNLAWSAGAETISPNTFYVWGAVTGLEIEFGDKVDGVANEYLFQFMCDEYEETTIILPDTIVWPNGTPSFYSGCTYQISVLNDIGLVVKHDPYN